MSRSRSLDPALATLFATSLGPVKSTPRRTLETAVAVNLPKNATKPPNKSAQSLQTVEQDEIDTADSALPEDRGSEKAQSGKRKKRRRHDDDDLEGRYMDGLNRDEVREDMKKQEERSAKKQKVGKEASSQKFQKAESESNSGGRLEILQGALHHEKPQHETMLSSGKDASQEDELEKATRTVFLANVSTETIKSKSARKTLINHLESFVSTLPTREITHKIESLRFRSTAFSSNGLPKKAAFIRKELMDSTTRSTNAYAVYSTLLAAKEAVIKLNGTIVLDRHLRVDGLAHPAKVDHRRCVFVGNLTFVDDETKINEAANEQNQKPIRKGKEPADAEEGLWRVFSKAGSVESVRVIRDKSTRVGKGFAYVQFQDANGVEKALQFHGKKFPPMLPRLLRVVRAKSVQNQKPNHSLQNHQPHSKKKKSRLSSNPASAAANDVNYTPKLSSEVASLLGRANKLLGRAGAAQLRNPENRNPASTINGNKEQKLKGGGRESGVIFEGHRASSGSSARKEVGKHRPSGVLGRKKKGKPQGRSTVRAAAFKASGGKKKNNVQ